MCLNIDLYYTEAALGYSFLKELKTGKHIKYRLFHFTLLFRLSIHVATTDARHTLANHRTMNSFNIYHTLSLPCSNFYAELVCHGVVRGQKASAENAKVIKSSVCCILN